MKDVGIERACYASRFHGLLSPAHAWAELERQQREKKKIKNSVGNLCDRVSDYMDIAIKHIQDEAIVRTEGI